MWSEDQPGEPRKGRPPRGARAADDRLAPPGRRSRGGGGRLALDLDDRLPWLEEDDRDEGIDHGRVAGFVVLGLLVLALIVGALWWVNTMRGPGEADGSLVHAEPGPYKVRPENPGGKTFAGTGDSAYAVSEGERRGAALAAGRSRPVAETAAPTPESGGVGVQIGAYVDREAAEAAWAALVQRAPVLSGYPHRVVEGRADIGTAYRLQAVAGNVAAADELCRALRSSGQDCQVKP